MAQNDRLNLDDFEKKFEEKVIELSGAHHSEGFDPAHDFLHFRRVVNTAKKICQQEGAKPEIVIPAAWFHDFVIVPKNDPRRAQASTLSSHAAQEFLLRIQYPVQYLEEIGHAIAAHSFSAAIAPRTLEAKIVQDADRLDGLGAIGIARCFATAGLLKRPFYSIDDPFCSVRPPDDGKFTIDHFYAKLFKVAQSLQTEAGRTEGKKRLEIMKVFLNDFSFECI